MTTDPIPTSVTEDPLFKLVLKELVQKHSLAAESLTERQLADAIRQAINAGDFVRNLSFDGINQSVSYIPYREVERWKNLYHELLHAVSSVYLRYITEAESKSCLPKTAAELES